MKYSFIIPTYNIENYIEECVHSVLKQTFKDFEIVLVNDGSTDRSLEKCKSLQKEDIRVKVVDKANGGLSSARNAGLEVAQGDYIIYVDGDDWVSPDMLELAENFQSSNGSVDILCFDLYKAYADKNILDDYRIKEGVYKGIDFFLNSRFLAVAASKVFKKDFLQEQGLKFLVGRLHEDMSYTIPLCIKADRIGYVQKPVYYYRQNRDGSIMSKIKQKNVDDFTHALCFDCNYLSKELTENAELQQWFLNGFYNSCFTAEITYSMLKEAFLKNSVFTICHTLSGIEPRNFWNKVRIKHYYYRFRKCGGNIRRFFFGNRK